MPGTCLEQMFTKISISSLGTEDHEMLGFFLPSYGLREGSIAVTAVLSLTQG